MAYTYDNDETSAPRWLILNDKEQEFPTGNFRVESIEERKTASGKTMPVMTLVEEETGSTVLICAWKRDVKKAITDYGTDPLKWGPVRFEFVSGRYQVVPAAMDPIIETVA